MENSEPDFIVVGAKVALGPLRQDLAASYARWMNQLEVRHGQVQLGIATPQTQGKWVEENVERGAEREPKAVEFTVYERTNSTPVGTAGLRSLSSPMRRFVFEFSERRPPSCPAC
jgi:diamine N-acetyltransferase